MKKVLFSFGLTVCSILFAQKPFVGSIEFMFYQRDTTKNVFTAKESFVRLDQYSKKTDGTIEGGFLFDLTKKEIKFINPKRKVWGIHNSTVPPAVKGECVVTKTKNAKVIQGVKCTEYIVKNTTEDTEISYWIGSGNYDFFIPMMQLWNRKDKQSIYFSKITGLAKGSMPMLSLEKQISSGKIISKLETIKISAGNVTDDKLSVPTDYKKFEEQ